MMVKRFLKKVFQSEKSKGLVLMYHRIATPKTDPWQIAVSPDNFEQHLAVLKTRYNVISIAELLRQLSNNKIEANSICITFDDAYADNYLYAKPLLEKYKLPAAFFVPASYIGQNKQFWWDELADIILHTVTLPALLSIFIDQELFEFELDIQTLTKEYEEQQHTWIWSDSPPTKRCELYLEIWKRLQPLTAQEITQVIEKLRSWAAYKPVVAKEDVAMNIGQLREMSNSPLFTIGIHTLTHPALSCHSKELQSQEIAACKKLLEEYTGLKINTIAYPYGKYNMDTLAIVKELELSAGFTTEKKAVDNLTKPYKIGRLQVINQTEKEFGQVIERWKGLA